MRRCCHSCQHLRSIPVISKTRVDGAVSPAFQGSTPLGPIGKGRTHVLAHRSQSWWQGEPPGCSRPWSLGFGSSQISWRENTESCWVPSPAASEGLTLREAAETFITESPGLLAPRRAVTHARACLARSGASPLTAWVGSPVSEPGAPVYQSAQPRFVALFWPLLSLPALERSILGLKVAASPGEEPA